MNTSACPVKIRPIAIRKKAAKEKTTCTPSPLPKIDYLALAQSFQPGRPTRTEFTPLPSEVHLLIMKDIDSTGLTCLSLPLKYLVLLGSASKATFPSIKGRYNEDRRRLAFLNLLIGWMSRTYRMCYMCRLFRPIIGGQVRNLSKKSILLRRFLKLMIVEGVPIRKRAPKSIPWKDEHWTFLSLGKRVSKSGMVETRTFCPACI